MIELKHLQKQYDGFSLDCTMSVQPGCITGLVGRNGAGKSTTFKALLGLISTDGGEARLFGKDAARITGRDKQKIGVVLSDSGFNPFLGINGIARILDAMYVDFDKEEFLRTARRLKLPPDKKLKDFSNGMKAKLKVLVALCHKAQILILDEPTAGLDVVARDAILDMLREYMEKNENASILISSHIATDLESICDDIYMIDDGKIVFHEDTDVLLGSYALMKVTPQTYENLDKRYLVKVRKESFGYKCLTNQKQYYMENNPQAVIENGSIDDVIVMLSGGEQE